MASSSREFGIILSGSNRPNNELIPETRVALIACATAGEARQVMVENFRLHHTSVATPLG